MKCPRDADTLAPFGAAGGLGHRCGRCSGTLIPERQLMRSVGQGSGARLATSAGLASLRNLPEGGCACPRDGRPMRLLRHLGVELDICTACHAVWLDGGEQAKIQAMARRERVAIAGQRSADDAGEALFEGAVEFVLEAVGSILGGS